MAALDKDRPLWEFTVLDGLADGGAALVIKVHHSLTDGVSGMQLTREITDTTREREPARSALVSEKSMHSELSESSGHQRFAAVAAAVVPAARAATSTVRAGAHALWHPGSSGCTGVGIAASALRMARPATTTLSPVMKDRSTRRCFGTLEVSAAALTAAAAVTQCSINDAFVAAVLLGMAQYHQRHGAMTPELRVTLPISLRTSQDPLGGNRITLARFALPINIADPDQLMHRVHAVVDRWRREPAVPLSPQVAGVLNLLPVAVLGNMLKHMDFVASNVAGPSMPLYIAGAEITRQFAFSPTLGSAFNATLMSYTTHMCVGINADAGAIADLPVLMEAISDGFRAVLETCPKRIDTTVTAEC
jgi:WS/DGAT/MGAT family acyltransferase